MQDGVEGIQVFVQDEDVFDCTVGNINKRLR